MEGAALPAKSEIDLLSEWLERVEKKLDDCIRETNDVCTRVTVVEALKFPETINGFGERLGEFEKKLDVVASDKTAREKRLERMEKVLTIVLGGFLLFLAQKAWQQWIVG